MSATGRFLWMLISVTMALLAANFAISNDSIIILSLWPLTNKLEVALWMFGITAFIGGGTIGALIVWAHTLTIRTKFWFLKSKYNKLKSKISSESLVENSQLKPLLSSNSKRY